MGLRKSHKTWLCFKRCYREVTFKRFLWCCKVARTKKNNDGIFLEKGGITWKLLDPFDREKTLEKQIIYLLNPYATLWDVKIE